MLALAAPAERLPFERYQSILDRQMFGALPPGFDPTKMSSEVAKAKASKELTEEQEKLKSAVHFSVINVRPDGKTEVGFTDSSDPKTPHHYFICEGETAGGWKVESVDPDTASMTILKDGIQLELTLGDNSATGGGNASKVGTPGARTLMGGMRSSGGAQSLRARRAQREQEASERARLEAERQARREAAEEKEKAERAAEREEQRQQLLAIQEELRRSREEQEKLKKAAEEKEGAEEAKSESAENEAN